MYKRQGFARNINLVDLTAHAVDLDLASLTAHGERNARTLLAAQPLGRLGAGQAGRVLPVDPDNQVADLQAGLLSRGIPQHLADLHAARSLLQAHADADKALQSRKALRVLLARQVHGMGIQQGQNIVDDMVQLDVYKRQT